MTAKPTHALAWIPCGSVWQLETRDFWDTEEPYAGDWDCSGLPRDASQGQLTEFVAGQLGYPVTLRRRWFHNAERFYYVSRAS